MMRIAVSALQDFSYGIVNMCRNRSQHLTRIRSATAGGSERELQWSCFDKVERGSTPASGWLHRLVRWLMVTYESESDEAGCEPDDQTMAVLSRPDDRS